MKLVLIADTFPPLRTSGAVQLRDLVRELVSQRHEVTVLLPAADLKDAWALEDFEGVQVLRLKSPRTKDVAYVFRTICECIMPYAMWWNLLRSPLAHCRWEGIVWYSPSIFHGPLVRVLKKTSRCRSYLIVRDIFPDWAADLGLMTRGLTFWFFKSIANLQYSVADVIGVQTPGNLSYFQDFDSLTGRKVEILQNWLEKPVDSRCSLNVTDTSLAGRKVFVYTGNMGVAQGMDIIVDLAERLRDRNDIGFLLVGRGSEVSRLTTLVDRRGLDNVIFYDEITPDEIPGLYAQCSIGIVCLDPRHQSHNIPGKFISYVRSGLPVLANINTGNDLAKIIRDERIGEVCESNQLDDLLQMAERLLDHLENDPAMPMRCRELFQREFNVEGKVKQIVSGLTKGAN